MKKSFKILILLSFFSLITLTSCSKKDGDAAGNIGQSVKVQVSEADKQQIKNELRTELMKELANEPDSLVFPFGSDKFFQHEKIRVEKQMRDVKRDRKKDEKSDDNAPAAPVEYDTIRTTNSFIVNRDHTFILGQFTQNKYFTQTVIFFKNKAQKESFITELEMEKEIDLSKYKVALR